MIQDMGGKVMSPPLKSSGAGSVLLCSVLLPRLKEGLFSTQCLSPFGSSCAMQDCQASADHDFKLCLRALKAVCDWLPLLIAPGSSPTVPSAPPVTPLSRLLCLCTHWLLCLGMGVGVIIGLPMLCPKLRFVNHQ